MTLLADTKRTGSPTARALYRLWPKQQQAFDQVWDSGVEQMLFGGAVGGAKSHLARALAAYMAVLWPGSSVGIFRRTDKELQQTHVSKWLEEVDPFVPGGKFLQQKMEYHWPSPAWCWCPKGEPCAHSSVTAFCHIDENRGSRKYQGFEFAAQLIDEATHFRGTDIDYLYTRVRAEVAAREAHDVTGPDGKKYRHPGWPAWRKLQVLTANPGDVGHQYMLDNYIDPLLGLEQMRVDDGGDFDVIPREIIDGPHPILEPNLQVSVWEAPIVLQDGTETWLKVDMRGGQTWSVELDLGPRGKAVVKRAFVPSRLEDNPSLDAADYAASLSVGSAENRRRLLDGDWTFSEDRIFKVLTPETHLVAGERIFGLDGYGAVKPPPSDWLRGIGLDDGTAKPTAAIWLCYDGEGSFIAYREYYSPGPTGKHVRAVKDIMDWDGHPKLYVQADPRMWHGVAGIEQVISRAAIYQHLGEPPEDPIQRRMAALDGIKLVPSRIEDKAALIGVEEMIEPDPERPFPYWHPRSGEYGAPLLYVTDACPALWRELIQLRRPAKEDDGRYGEGIKNGQPDHAYDALKRIATPLRHAIIATRARPQGGPRRVIEAVGARREAPSKWS